MSTHTAKPRTRHARPRLRIFGEEPRPRHVGVVTFPGNTYFSVEVWTDAEWDAMAPAERPDNAAWMPGIGWFLARTVTREEAYGIVEMAANYPDLTRSSRSES